ncbi:cytidine deaminase-like protein [Halteromyces radiatus]|uniref:cytidine deaminase-like protein n=1 Tax=Halteromyces radiatus TaxID=101107 RepID=UPI00221E626D|nr:cytidine deaminase-like protein [Halteromyces radiatus]KAI8100160.1 cytidine deaminase-like protein [Halteromyces radiatus]
MMDEYGTQYTQDNNDIKYMSLAIEQAKKSIPAEKAYCVGACLVSKDGELLTTGFSRELPGNTHAEQCALLKLQDPNLASGGTMYTTMEPCSTRLSGNIPCVQNIINANITRVVMGVREPPNLVQCEGVQLLEQHGIQVFIVPGVQEECLAPNKHILH